MVREIDSDGGVADFAYDSLGYQVKSWDPLHAAGAKGNVASTRYDGLGNELDVRQVLTVNGRGDGTYQEELAMNFTWQEEERPLSLRDANGNLTTQSYDAAGMPSSSTETGAGPTQQKLDAEEKPRESTAADGTTQVFEYDALERLGTVYFTPGAGVIPTPLVETFSYDGLSNQTSASSDAQTIHRSYDSLSLLLREESNGRVIGYERDVQGRILGITYPDGASVGQVRDTQGRIQSISLDGQTLAIFGYEGDARVVARTLPAIDLQSTWDIGGEGALTGVTHTSNWAIVDQRIYGRDEAGQRLTEDNPVLGTNVTAVYDSLGRMKVSSRTGFATSTGTGTTMRASVSMAATWQSVPPVIGSPMSAPSAS